MRKLGLLLLICFGISTILSASDLKSNKSRNIRKMNAGCDAGTASALLEINQVRTLILNGGDLWWDLSNARYEVPKVDPLKGDTAKKSIFCGAIRFAGIDAGGLLKGSAQTYRQGTVLGVGFWPGHLADSNGIDPTQCMKYDKVWNISHKDIQKHQANPQGYTPPSTFTSWPAFSEKGNALAPFVDVDGDGKYNPMVGDYPKIKGDQSIWFVFNDKGGPGQGAGIEYQCMAFAKAGANALNTTTFYDYTIVNRGNNNLSDCWIGMFFDPDLGNAADDYHGCDPSRSIAYCYNSDNDDDGMMGYGKIPPAVGIEVLRGPQSIPNNGKDDDHDGKVDELDTVNGVIQYERLRLTNFLGYYTGGSPISNPDNLTEVYANLRSYWKNGVKMVYGGLGYPGTPGASTTPTDFMYSGYPWNPSDWHEFSAGQGGGDRKFQIGCGPFTFRPGQAETFSFSVVWARSDSGNQYNSLQKLLDYADQIQRIYDNDFRILSGPDAPDVKVAEFNRSVVLSWENAPTSNNYKNSYKEFVYESDSAKKGVDTHYRFQGYQVFQLKNAAVTVDELGDLNKARLVAQSDIKDSVSKILNNYYSAAMEMWVPTLMVDGANTGLKMSVEIKTDAFGTQNGPLVNHRPYYFMVVAYGYNNYKTFIPGKNNGQALPYFRSTRNIQVVTAIPHKTETEMNGLTLQSTYGLQPAITRLEGSGNGGFALQLAPTTEEQIVQNSFAQELNYLPNHGPINVYVTNPKLIPTGVLTIKLANTSGTAFNDSAKWVAEYNGQLIRTESSIGKPQEEGLFANAADPLTGEITFRDLGLKLEISQDPKGVRNGENSPVIDASMHQNGSNWLQFIKDSDRTDLNQNWILSGLDTPRDIEGDYKQYYEGILDGSFAPFEFVSGGGDFPAYQSIGGIKRPSNPSNQCPSVKLVFTADQSKWTRSLVIETGSSSAQQKNLLRLANSVDKNGNIIPNDYGRGWFPGFAINLETGERLNIAFGENSSDVANQGDDMRWNPTSNQFVNRAPVLGGKHFIYVLNTKYDEGNAGFAQMSAPSIQAPAPINVNRFYRTVTWVSIPIKGSQPLLETEAEVTINHYRPYANMPIGSTSLNNGNPMYRIDLSKVAPIVSQSDVMKQALATAQIVPNPYYAYAEYSGTESSREVKITNLPPSCTIQIFNVSGSLVKTIRKNDALTYVSWDGKNNTGSPLSSGAYVIHINAGVYGDRTLKWFAVMD